DQNRVDEALVVCDEQDRAAPRDVAAADRAETEQEDQEEPADPPGELVEHGGEERWHRRTSVSMRATTSSSGRWVVSRTIASAAGTIGARSRPASRRSRSSWSARTFSNGTSPPRATSS